MLDPDRKQLYLIHIFENPAQLYFDFPRGVGTDVIWATQRLSCLDYSLCEFPLPLFILCKEINVTIGPDKA